MNFEVSALRKAWEIAILRDVYAHIPDGADPADWLGVVSSAMLRTRDMSSVPVAFGGGDLTPEELQNMFPGGVLPPTRETKHRELLEQINAHHKPATPLVEGARPEVCPVAGCPGDYRYAPPGRSHTCTGDEYRAALAAPEVDDAAADGQTFSGVRCELCGVVRMNAMYSHEGVVRCQDHYICAQVAQLVGAARSTYDDLVEAGWRPRAPSGARPEVCRRRPKLLSIEHVDSCDLHTRTVGYACRCPRTYVPCPKCGEVSTTGNQHTPAPEGAEEGAAGEALAVLRVPTGYAENPDGHNLNTATSHIDVPVILDPSMTLRGETRHGYEGPIIALREWNEQVLLHEVLHVALGWVQPPLAESYPPQGHKVITTIEVALTELGYLSPTQVAAAERGAEVRGANDVRHRVRDALNRHGAEQAGRGYALWNDVAEVVRASAAERSES